MITFYESTPKGCAFPEERRKIHKTIYWLVANDAGDVTVVEKRSGCMLSLATLGCGCSTKTMPLADVGAYLEEKYAAGAFRELVLAGHPEAMYRLRHFLPPEMAALITTELNEADEQP